MNGSAAGWGGDPLRRPRLRRGLAIARTPHGLLLEGGPGVFPSPRDPAAIRRTWIMGRDRTMLALWNTDGPK
jgi:hypothetical protein